MKDVVHIGPAGSPRKQVKKGGCRSRNRIRGWWLASMLGTMGAGCGLPAEGLEPGSCGDRVDNDGDYSFDCDDPGCAGAPECQGMGVGATDKGGIGFDTGDTGALEPTSPGDEDAQPVTGSCNENQYTLNFDDGTQLVLNAWVWEGWGGAHLVGMATNGADGCAVASEFFTSFSGYDTWFFQIDLPTVPGAGDVVRIQDADSATGTDGTARLENLATGALETSQDGGRMAVQQAALGAVFTASDVYTRMSGGTAPQGDLVACWCDATPIGPAPDDDGGRD